MPHRLRNAVAVVWIAVATGVVLAAEEPSELRTVGAVWEMREVEFQYRSGLAIFSCGALQGRVATLLRAIGAHDNLQVKVDDCSSSLSAPGTVTDTATMARTRTPWGRPDPVFQQADPQLQFVNVRVRAFMPVEATPEILAELARDQPRRELVARMTGSASDKPDQLAVFAAQRRSVTLSRTTVGLEPIECELIDQLTNVVDDLGVRVVRKGANCNRDRVSRISPKLVVEALMPVRFDARQPVVDEPAR